MLSNITYPRLHLIHLETYLNTKVEGKWNDLTRGAYKGERVLNQTFTGTIMKFQTFIKHFTRGFE